MFSFAARFEPVPDVRTVDLEDVTGLITKRSKLISEMKSG